MVVGIAELGAAVGDEASIDPIRYQEDHDNYLDIILAGDAAAVARLTTVVMPTATESGYSEIYNPGGPGRTPTEGVILKPPEPNSVEATNEAAVVSPPQVPLTSET